MHVGDAGGGTLCCQELRIGGLFFQSLATFWFVSKLGNPKIGWFPFDFLSTTPKSGILKMTHADVFV